MSALIAFDRSTLGNVIERLESKGFLERKPGPGDKRVKLLYLTKSGAGELRNVEPLVTDAQIQMLQPLTAADRKTLLRLMTQLVNQNNEMPPVPIRAEDAILHLNNSA
ncbi:MAG: transcriptional regulator [Tardiphaga sp.]|nr:transcriptional regulator [Tardiphaga sp.]